VFVAISTLTQAQIDWKRSSANANLPTWMGTGNTERGMTVVGTKMYVVSRFSGTKIKVVNTADGTDLPEVSNYTGIAGGTFTLNDVEASSNGSILACNLTGSATVPGSYNFKVYRWDSDTATPTIYINYVYTTAMRLGDTFTVTGDVNGNAVIYAGNAGGNSVVKWTVTGGVLDTNPTILTFSDGIQGNIFNVYPMGLGATDGFIANSNGKTPTLYSVSGTIATKSLTEVVPSSVVSTGSNDTKYFEITDTDAVTKKYLASFIYGTVGEYTQIVDVTNGFALATTVGLTTKLGATANGNGSGGNAVIVRAPNAVDVFTLSTNNGISGKTILDPTLGNNKLTAYENHKAAKLFPNPATSSVNIVYDTQLQKNASASFYSTDGKLVKNAVINSNIQEVNVDDLPKGVYMVRFQNGKDTTTSKLVKN
jgi:hypothetical protein